MWSRVATVARSANEESIEDEKRDSSNARLLSKMAGTKPGGRPGRQGSSYFDVLARMNKPCKTKPCGPQNTNHKIVVRGAPS